SSQYVSLSSNAVSNLSDFTISTWVYLNSTSNWTRIFDFGDPSATSLNERYMFLSPQGGNGKVRFAITNSGGTGEESIVGGAPLPTGQWVHVAVTMSGRVGTLYVNGMVAGQNADMSFTPNRLISFGYGYIGKSGFANDPYLNGKVDDFRIYRGALTTADVQTLASTGVAHLKFNETAGTLAADSTFNGWNGTLVNGPTWTAGALGNAVNLA